MIYTRAQLDEVIEAAERRGFGPPSPTEDRDPDCEHDTKDARHAGRMYRGYPIGWVPDQHMGCTFRLWLAKGDLRPMFVLVAPWLVDELKAPRVEKQDPEHDPGNCKVWRERFEAAVAVSKTHAAGPWKAWPENLPNVAKKCLVRLPGGALIAVYCATVGGVNPGVWLAVPGAEHLEGVTHFAELNTEGT